MYLYRCKCGFEETGEVLEFKRLCPKCGERVLGEFEAALLPKPIKLSDMGICRRCGKFASSGAWIKGEWYGPECKDKV